MVRGLKSKYCFSCLQAKYAGFLSVFLMATIAIKSESEEFWKVHLD